MNITCLHSSNPPTTSTVLTSLQHVAIQHGAATFDTRVAHLHNDLAQDLRTIERGVSAVIDLAQSTIAGGPAAYLLAKGGKRLRPLLVVLASRCGSGLSAEAAGLALAVELVHNATLLHDDVVDLGETRRGAPTARIVYGNAAAIFAGDWLLLDGLRRVRETQVPLVLEKMLDVIQEMINAEVKQLQNRGRGLTDLGAYFDVIMGKTGSLFGWAMFAGAVGGGIAPAVAAHFERFGRHLGIAFQIVDDLLDVQGDTATIGKAVFADLLEGKATLPTVLAAQNDPSAAQLFSDLASGVLDITKPEIRNRIADCLARSEALVRTKTIAEHHIAQALAALVPVPDSAAKRVLMSVARATTDRDK